MGAAAEYFTGNIPMGITTATLPSAAASYSGRTESQHANLHTTSDFQTTMGPSRPSKQSSGSYAPVYGAAAAAGLAGVAEAAYNHHEQAQYQQTSPNQDRPQSLQGHDQSALPAMRHRRRQKHSGGLGRLVDWWQNYDDVAKFEEYTHTIGVCRNCFDPNSSPLDAPRKHHYHRRRSSGSRYDSTTRVDKVSRYSSDEDKRKRKSAMKVITGGIAAAGGAAIGEAISNRKNDFDDTYSVKSGRPSTRSRVSFREEQDRYSDQRTYSASDTTSFRRRDKSHPDRKDDNGYGYVESPGPISKGAVLSTGIAGVAVSSVMAVKEQKRGQRRRKSSDSPYYHRQVSPRHSYVDLSATKNGSVGFGEFFSSPSANKKRGKKAKGFFTLANASSSSSDADLAFGEGTVRRKSSIRKDTGAKIGDTAAILGLAATGGVLANEYDRRNKKGKHKADTSIETPSRTSSRPTHISLQDRESVESANEDVWEDASHDETSSADSGLAYGGAKLSTKLSRESLNEGTDKWDWRWRNSERPKKNRRISRTDHQGNEMLATGAVVGALVGTTLSESSSRPGPVGSTSGSPTLQRLDPVATSDSSTYDVRRSSGASEILSRSSAPLVVAANKGPLQQPQPVTPISPNAYDPTRYSNLPAGPIIFENKHISNGLTESPTQLPSSGSASRVQRQQKSGRRRDSSPAALPGRSRRDSVRFDLPGDVARSHRENEDRTREALDTSRTLPKSERSSNEARAARETEIERELERLYEEDRRQAAERSRRSAVKTVAEVTAVGAIGDGIAVTARERSHLSSDEDERRRDTSRKKRRDSLKQSGEQDTEQRETQQERIAKTAAQRVKASPSPVYEDYQTFFVPEELAKDLPEHNAKAAERDEHEYDTTNIVEIDPDGVKVRDIDNPFLYRRFGQDPKDDPKSYPWLVPQLRLMEPTPPQSRAASVRDERSPVIMPQDPPEDSPVQSDEKTQRARSASGSRVTWGDHDTYVYEVQTPEWERTTPDWEKPGFNVPDLLSQAQGTDEPNFTKGVQSEPHVPNTMATQRDHLSKGGDFEDLPPQSERSRPGPENQVARSESSGPPNDDLAASQFDSRARAIAAGAAVAAAAAGALRSSTLDKKSSKESRQLPDLQSSPFPDRKSGQSIYKGPYAETVSDLGLATDLSSISPRDHTSTDTLLSNLQDSQISSTDAHDKFESSRNEISTLNSRGSNTEERSRASRSEGRRQERAVNDTPETSFPGATKDSGFEEPPAIPGAFNVFDYLVEEKGETMPTASVIGNAALGAQQAAEMARTRTQRGSDTPPMTRRRRQDAEAEAESQDFKPLQRAMTLGDSDLGQTGKAARSEGHVSDPEEWERSSKKGKRSKTQKREVEFFDRAALAMASGAASVPTDDFYDSPRGNRRTKKDGGDLDDDTKSVTSSPAAFRDMEDVDEKKARRRSKLDGEIHDENTKPVVDSPSEITKNKEGIRKSKDKKSSTGGLWGTLFSAVKSDVSSSSTKSKSGSKAEDDYTKRKKGKSRDGESAGEDFVQRRSRSESRSSAQESQIRDDSLAESFKSADEHSAAQHEKAASEIEDAKPFLAMRPEMPTGTNKRTVDAAGVSGLDTDVHINQDHSSANDGIVATRGALERQDDQKAKAMADAAVAAAFADEPMTQDSQPPTQSEVLGKRLAEAALAAAAGTNVDTNSAVPQGGGQALEYSRRLSLTQQETELRRLSGLKTADIGPGAVATSSPTAVPISFRRPPISPATIRAGTLGSPGIPASPSGTSRTRQGRPLSTEIRSKEVRPLYLVERHSSARQAAPEPEQSYPSLPSSRTSSAHPSLENLRATEEEDASFASERMTPQQLRRQSRGYWHDAGRPTSPEYLDSGQVTPTAASPQLSRKERPKYEFHSPSELLQEPLQLVQPDADDGQATRIPMSTPLPSVLGTEDQGEQNYHSDQSRSRSISPTGIEQRDARDRNADRQYWRDAALGALSGTAVAAGINATDEGAKDEMDYQNHGFIMPEAPSPPPVRDNFDQSRSIEPQVETRPEADDTLIADPRDIDPVATFSATKKKQKDKKDKRDKKSKKAKNGTERKLSLPEAAVEEQPQATTLEVLPVLSTSNTEIREPSGERSLAESFKAPGVRFEAGSPDLVRELLPEAQTVAAELHERSQSVDEQDAEVGDLDTSPRAGITSPDEAGLATPLDETDRTASLSEGTARTSFPFSEAVTPASRSDHTDPMILLVGNSKRAASVDQVVERRRDDSFVPAFEDVNQPANELSAFEEAFERARRVRGLVDGIGRDEAMACFLPRRDNVPFVEHGALTPIGESSQQSTPAEIPKETRLTGNNSATFSSNPKKGRRKEKQSRKGSKVRDTQPFDERESPREAHERPVLEHDDDLGPAIATVAAASVLLVQDASKQADVETGRKDFQDDKNPFGDDFEIRANAVDGGPSEKGPNSDDNDANVPEESTDPSDLLQTLSKADKKKRRKTAVTFGIDDGVSAAPTPEVDVAALDDERETSREKSKKRKEKKSKTIDVPDKPIETEERRKKSSTDRHLVDEPEKLYEHTEAAKPESREASTETFEENEMDIRDVAKFETQDFEPTAEQGDGDADKEEHADKTSSRKEKKSKKEKKEKNDKKKKGTLKEEEAPLEPTSAYFAATGPAAALPTAALAESPFQGEEFSSKSPELRKDKEKKSKRESATPLKDEKTEATPSERSAQGGETREHTRDEGVPRGDGGRASLQSLTPLDPTTSEPSKSGNLDPRHYAHDSDHSVWLQQTEKQSSAFPKKPSTQPEHDTSPGELSSAQSRGRELTADRRNSRPDDSSYTHDAQHLKWLDGSHDLAVSFPARPVPESFGDDAPFGVVEPQPSADQFLKPRTAAKTTVPAEVRSTAEDVSATTSAEEETQTETIEPIVSMDQLDGARSAESGQEPTGGKEAARRMMSADETYEPMGDMGPDFSSGKFSDDTSLSRSASFTKAEKKDKKKKGKKRTFDEESAPSGTPQAKELHEPPEALSSSAIAAEPTSLDAVTDGGQESRDIGEDGTMDTIKPARDSLDEEPYIKPNKKKDTEAKKSKRGSALDDFSPESDIPIATEAPPEEDMTPVAGEDQEDRSASSASKPGQKVKKKKKKIKSRPSPWDQEETVGTPFKDENKADETHSLESQGARIDFNSLQAENPDRSANEPTVDTSAPQAQVVASMLAAMDEPESTPASTKPATPAEPAEMTRSAERGQDEIQSTSSRKKKGKKEKEKNRRTTFDDGATDVTGSSTPGEANAEPPFELAEDVPMVGVPAARSREVPDEAETTKIYTKSSKRDKKRKKLDFALDEDDPIQQAFTDAEPLHKLPEASATDYEASADQYHNETSHFSWLGDAQQLAEDFPRKPSANFRAYGERQETDMPGDESTIDPDVRPTTPTDPTRTDETENDSKRIKEDKKKRKSRNSQPLEVINDRPMQFDKDLAGAEMMTSTKEDDLISTTVNVEDDNDFREELRPSTSKSKRKDKKKRKSVPSYFEKEEQDRSYDETTALRVTRETKVSQATGNGSITRGKTVVDALNLGVSGNQEADDEDDEDNGTASRDEAQPMTKAPTKTSTFDNLHRYDLSSAMNSPNHGRKGSFVMPGAFSWEENDPMFDEPGADRAIETTNSRPDEPPTVDAKDTADMDNSLELDRRTSDKRKKKENREKKSKKSSKKSSTALDEDQNLPYESFRGDNETPQASEPRDLTETHRSASAGDRPVSPDSMPSTSRERRRRRRSPVQWDGEEPPDLPGSRGPTPPADHDAMIDTALSVAAGLGLTGGAPDATRSVDSDQTTKVLQPYVPAQTRTKDAPGWSFANLGALGPEYDQEHNRDSGVQFEDPSALPKSMNSGARDSGYVASPVTRNSWQAMADNAAHDRLARPPSPTSSAEDIRDVGLPKDEHSRNIAETPVHRRPSPVDSTTKDRSSALFDSSPSIRNTPQHSSQRIDTEHLPPPTGELHRSPSIHGHHRSREDLRGPSLSGGGSQHDSQSTRHHQQPVLSPSRSHFMDLPFSPPRAHLDTIQEHATSESNRRQRDEVDSRPTEHGDSSLNRKQSGGDLHSAAAVASLAGAGTLVAAALTRDSQPSFRSLGESANSRSQPDHRFDARDLPKTSIQGLNDFGSGSARNMADFYVSSTSVYWYITLLTPFAAGWCRRTSRLSEVSYPPPECTKASEYATNKRS